MIKSMTGFGRSNLQENSREYQVEIKSVNHKYIDINVRMPRNISFLEDEVRKIISSRIKRGKIDVFITFDNYSEEGKVYIESLKELAKEEKLNNNLEVTEITKLPDVLVIKNNEDEEILKIELSKAVNNAVDKLIEMRKTEGLKMSEDALNRIAIIEGKVKEISELSTGLIDEYVVKLEARIKELLKTDEVDRTRLAQEVVIYADKCSVQEEITRLNSHIEQFRQLIKSESAAGKKLDFIIQEMNRETNTVIDIKTELEDIREQIQNIE